MKKHIVLIGLPGSGKTTVGRIVAEKGEQAFRDMERKEMEAALANQPAVLAPGGGWAAQPGALESAKPAGYVIYLKARPETAASRAAPSGTRPVLMGEDPEAQMRNLIKEREPFYLKADAKVETDKKTPDQIAAEVVRLAQTSAGW